MSFVRCIECTACKKTHAAGAVWTTCTGCGRMLAVRYDLERVKTAVTPAVLATRGRGMYRFRELLPLEDAEAPVTLGEGSTPLLVAPRLATHAGLEHLYIKDEGANPTGTFKSRGLGMAITRARHLGAKGFVIPSAGNAGGAAAVFGARAGIPVVVVVPKDTPPAAVAEAIIAGAKVFAIEGSIATAGQVVRGLMGALGPKGWVDLSTLKEPYRLEGKKTMGLEIAEDLGFTAPDTILYPAGGGTGLIGIAKAYEELGAIGWIKGSRKMPRFIAVQAEGCAPVVKAWREGAKDTVPWDKPSTHAAGLRVPSPFAGAEMLRVLRDSQGDALAVSEDAIREAQKTVARLEGLWMSPEAAATAAALFELVSSGRAKKHERIVLVSTGTGLKNDPPPLPPPTDLGQEVGRGVELALEKLAH